MDTKLRLDKPKYTIDDWAYTVDRYFKSCMSYQLDKDGAPVLDGNGNHLYTYHEMPSIIGLCVFCGINKSNFYRTYLENDGYSDISRSAKDKIEAINVQKLYNRETVQGAKFILTVGFQDYKETTNINVNSVSRLSDSELDSQIKLLQDTTNDL